MLYGTETLINGKIYKPKKNESNKKVWENEHPKNEAILFEIFHFSSFFFETTTKKN